MPITRSDRISGSLFVIATDADDAKDKALDHLRDSSGSYDVFDTQDAADSALYDRHGTYDRNYVRVYAVTLNIRVADQEH